MSGDGVRGDGGVCGGYVVCMMSMNECDVRVRVYGMCVVCEV